MDSFEKRSPAVIGIHTGDSRSGLVWGGFIALVGLALLLDHLGFLVLDHLYRFWPLIIVVAGVGQLVSSSNRAWGGFLIVVGAVFQLQTLGLVHVRFTELWPVAIIAFGFLVMWGSRKGPVTLVTLSNPSSAPDRLSAVAVFGGCERRINNPNFKGGSATAIFGGIELDFRDADIDGDRAVVDINCIFGGVEVRVPDTWQVHSSNLPVLGGYSDKTRLAAPADSANAKRKTLVITGTILFGGVDISN